MSIKKEMMKHINYVVETVKLVSSVQVDFDKDISGLQDQLNNIQSIHQTIRLKKESMVRDIVSCQASLTNQMNDVSISLSEKEISLTRRINEIKSAIEEEKKKKEEADAERDKEILAVEKLLEYVNNAATKSTSAQILIYIEQVEPLVVDGFFGDRMDSIQVLKDATLDNLRYLFKERAEKERLAYEEL